MKSGLRYRVLPEGTLFGELSLRKKTPQGGSLGSGHSIFPDTSLHFVHFSWCSVIWCLRSADPTDVSGSEQLALHSSAGEKKKFYSGQSSGPSKYSDIRAFIAS